ncbi:gliding motility-associated C-terminal domain-containing protein [Larkinella terrae]|uniref:T9SS type B sorting domain-containing protein n=1 Tax=Larkinella terrae TaxID=2025311 RepID=A0A7K0EEP0_9BACT|nr:gliding motility-associated C-terminal domain-containing protein [Larkinella terrae]MRS60309.1 T9SS type B sorting domain-containing protein [Larkinella terrae]
MKHFYFLIWGLFSAWAAYGQNCPTLAIPAVKISQVGHPNEAANASFCTGESVQLNALTGAVGVSYQWKRNGADVAGASGSSLVVNQAGEYSVTINQTGNCTGSAVSANTTISTNQCGSGGLLPILGGQLEDYNGSAELQSSVFLRAVYLTNTGSRNKFPLSIRAYVYRKRDNGLVTTVTMSRGSVLDGQYTPLPAACNGDSSKIQDVLYFGAINFQSAVYNDPGGYYVTTEPVCCREVSDNINGTGPVVFYMELGDRTKYNVTASHSTFGGIFGLPSRIETCVNQPVRLASYSYPSANLTRIQYSLVSPSTGDANTPVKDVGWATGYGASSFMESSSPLQIDQNGVITGTPTKVGTYRYVVKAELFQGAFKGFELRRELVIQVKECPAVTTPTVVVTAVGKPGQPAGNTLCENDAVQLNAKSPLKNVNYQWYLDGKVISGATDSVLISRQAGRYTVLVSKELACPRSAVSSPVSITVSPNPTVNLTVSNTTGALCQGGSLTLTAASTAAGATYRWQRDSTTLVGTTGPRYETGVAGNYLVSVTDANGCSGRSASLAVATNSPPDATILPAANTVCPGSVLRLQATTSNGATYQWLKDGTPVSGATSAVYDVSAAGMYSVVVRGANSCTATSGSKIVSTATLPTVSLSGPAQLCRNASATLTATGSSGTLQYLWLLDGSGLPGATTATYEAKKGGNYQVRVTDPNQCSAVSTNWPLAEIDKIDVRLDSIPPFCGIAGAPLQLVGTPVGGSFSGNGVSGTRFSPALAGVGTHEIIYTITGASACQSGTAKRTVLVRPLPEVNLPNLLKIQRGTSVNLPGPTGAAYQYNWSPPTGLDHSTIASPLASPDTSTTYRLVVQDQFGCTAEGRVLVSVSTQLYVPEIFTPNGDGHNDVWELRNAAHFKNVEVAVYNRWGVVVFHSIGYNEPFSGQNLPDGVYTYVIRYDSPAKRLAGTVIVTR